MSPQDNAFATLDRMIIARAAEAGNELDVDEPDLVMPPTSLRLVKPKK